MSASAVRHSAGFRIDSVRVEDYSPALYQGQIAGESAHLQHRNR
jgi:hypothetical protein